MGMCLTGNRLVLRPLEPKDCAEMVRILADPVISYWVPVLPFPYTASDAKGFSIFCRIIHIGRFGRSR